MIGRELTRGHVVAGGARGARSRRIGGVGAVGAQGAVGGACGSLEVERIVKKESEIFIGRELTRGHVVACWARGARSRRIGGVGAGGARGALGGA